MIVRTNIARSFFIAAFIAASPVIVAAQTIEAKPADKLLQNVTAVALQDTGRSHTYSYTKGNMPVVMSKWGKVVLANVPVGPVLPSASITAATIASEKPVDHIPTVKPDMDQYNMPVKKPAGNFAALSADLKVKNVNVNAEPHFTMNAPAPEVEAKLLGGSTGGLGGVTFGFGFAEGTSKMALTLKLGNTKDADVSLIDEDGKELWTAKTIGNKFFRTLDITENGTYYLVIKKDKKGLVRKITAE